MTTASGPRPRRRALILATRRLPAWVTSQQRWRLGSGLVLFVFSLTHFLNHALGLVSVEAMEAVQTLRAGIWNIPLFTALLYGAFAVHIGLGLWKVATRTTFRMPWWEAAQIGLGLAIPFWLIGHVVGTRMIGSLHDFDARYAHVLRLIWPDLAWGQSILLVIVWLHAVIGLHHWLKLKRWYAAASPWLLGLAVLVPALALAGWIEAARDVADLPPVPGLLNEEQVAWGTVYIARGYGAYYAIGAAIIAVVVGRRLVTRATSSIVISFTNGRTVRARPGASLLDIARANGIPHASICGGRGRCTTCRVQVISGLAALDPPGTLETAALARIAAPPGVRLACQARPVEDIAVHPLVPVAQAPAVVQGDPYRWGVERRITVMFADLRGFTTLSEKLYPYDAVFLLNRYFDVMAQAIRGQGGVVDKFLGDGIMALFGVDPQPGFGSRAAILAARDMAAALDALNLELGATLPAPLRMGIGIHQGPTVLGRVGAAATDGRGSLTALGDTVNIASRLESLNKTYGSTLVVSEETALASGLDLPAAATHEADVRGREAGVRVLVFNTLVGLADPPAETMSPAGRRA